MAMIESEVVVFARADVRKRTQSELWKSGFLKPWTWVVGLACVVL